MIFKPLSVSRYQHHHPWCYSRKVIQSSPPQHCTTSLSVYLFIIIILLNCLSVFLTNCLFDCLSNLLSLAFWLSFLSYIAFLVLIIINGTLMHTNTRILHPSTSNTLLPPMLLAFTYHHPSIPLVPLPLFSFSSYI